MDRPEAFREDRPEALHDFIGKNPVATLTTNGDRGLLATHAPVLLDKARGPKGSLVGHIARVNDPGVSSKQRKLWADPRLAPPAGSALARWPPQTLRA